MTLPRQAGRNPVYRPARSVYLDAGVTFALLAIKYKVPNRHAGCLCEGLMIPPVVGTSPGTYRSPRRWPGTKPDLVIAYSVWVSICIVYCVLHCQCLLGGSQLLGRFREYDLGHKALGQPLMTGEMTQDYLPTQVRHVHAEQSRYWEAESTWERFSALLWKD